MDFTHRLAISYYKTIAVINEDHNIFLVQHQETGKIYIKNARLRIFSGYLLQRSRREKNNFGGIKKCSRQTIRK